jgi:hypothetical protein
MYHIYKGDSWPEDTIKYKINDNWRVRLWTIVIDIVIDIVVFADTGASISAINAEYANTKFKTLITNRPSPLICRVANGNYIKLTQYIHLPICDKNGKIQFYHEFYLIPKLKHQFLASYYLLKQLHFEFPYDSPLLNPKSFEHFEEKDETFGTCNNWDKNGITARTKQNNYLNNPNFRPYKYHHVNSVQIDPLFYKYKPTSIVTDPYHNKLKSYNLNNYSSFNNVDISTIHAIKHKHTRIPFKTLHIEDNLLHISNYKASKEELQKASELCHETPLDPPNLDNIKQIDKQLHSQITKLLNTKYKNVFAKFQSDRKLIPNYEFKIDLIDDAPDKIFIPQYPLSPDKRLAVIHHTKQNLKTGLFIPDETSIHNVPIIVIEKKGGRLRLAYALQHLNKYTKTVKSYIPTYNYIFEQLRGPGLFTVTDLKNFFECIALREKDRPLCHVTEGTGAAQAS